MFDWNDEDQVGDTIWGVFNESEDHIVPYSKDSEENIVFTFGNYKKKQKNAAAAVDRSSEQISVVKNEFPGCSLENCSSFNTREELCGPRLDMDTWPDLQSLSELSEGFNNRSTHDSLGNVLADKMAGNMSEFYNFEMLLNSKETQSLDESHSLLAGGTEKLGGEPKLLGNEHQDKESNDFLDCDWATIGDFDDLDRIFRNDSIFGHDMVGNVDDFLSQSTDVLSSTAQSLPLPDLPVSRDQPPGQDCSSIQLVEHSGVKGKSEEKAGDRDMDTLEQTIHQTNLTNQLSEKEDRRKKLLKSRKKAEERSKKKALLNLSAPWPRNISQQFTIPVVQPSVISTLHTFQPPAFSQQRQLADAESTRHLGCSNQFMFSDCGYPTYPFPGILVTPHVQAEGKHEMAVAVGHKLYPDSTEQSKSTKIPGAQSRQLSMTPQEKIEKLRQQQQIQAMLAIQQQQQFGQTSQENSQKNQTLGALASNIGVEENPLKLPSPDLNILVEYDESQKLSSLIDDNSLEETVYYQLRDALGKLDIRVRLCIRDSLFRLARSSTERQSISDSSSTNKITRDEDDILVNEVNNLKQSQASLPDAETYTNPIDRTVAHLLFHRPSEKHAVPLANEILQSPISSNLGSSSTYKLIHRVFSARTNLL